MGFVLGKLFWGIAAPGNLLLLLLSLGALRLATGRRRRGFSLVATATLGFLAVAALPVGQWLAMPLEARFPRPQLPAGITGIIVLGGAVEPAITEAHGLIALNDATERLVEAVALARRYPEAKLMLSGGDASLLPQQGRDEADIMRDFLVTEGIDAARVLVENRSRNTFENAAYSRAIAKPHDGEVWLLVTSAAHMPRAVGCFRHVGWSVLPYPVDYRTEPNPRPSFRLGEHLALVDFAVREWVGLLGYRLVGHTDAIFPSP
jgi:uncharacterized SAM-binding protein YcdF (DUF218 family)